MACAAIRLMSSVFSPAGMGKTSLMDQRLIISDALSGKICKKNAQVLGRAKKEAHVRLHPLPLLKRAHAGLGVTPPETSRKTGRPCPPSRRGAPLPNVATIKEPAVKRLSLLA